MISTEDTKVRKTGIIFVPMGLTVLRGNARHSNNHSKKCTPKSEYKKLEGKNHKQTA